MLKRTIGEDISLLIELAQREDINEPATGLTPNLSICKWSGGGYFSGANAVNERSNGAYSVAITAGEISGAGGGINYRVYDVSGTALTWRDQIELVAKTAEDYLSDIASSLVSIATAIDEIPVGVFIGNGITPVDEDYGGANNLRVVDGDGNPLDNVLIYIYFKTDYLAGNTSSGFVKGFSVTNVNGYWEWPSNLDPQTYYVITQKTGYEQIAPKEIVVS